MTAVTLYAGFRAYETEQMALDLLGGMRHYDALIGLTLTRDTLEGVRYVLEESWVDPIIGARARITFTDNWFVTALVDYGGFEGQSDTSWRPSERSATTSTTAGRCRAAGAISRPRRRSAESTRASS